MATIVRMTFQWSAVSVTSKKSFLALAHDQKLSDEADGFAERLRVWRDCHLTDTDSLTGVLDASPFDNVRQADLGRDIAW
jgi:hypothetical protein